MTGLRIAQVAERTGVPASTLRYYEDIGLMAAAARTDNGYRAYTERDVDRLRFITRAKQLDLSLEDLRELLTAWDGEDCAGVQERMAAVVSARLAQTQERIIDLTALATQLQTATQRLSGEPAPGGCDDDCVCATAAQTTAQGGSADPATTPAGTIIPLTMRPATGAGGLTPAPPIACTLDARLLKGRVEEWGAILDQANARQPLPGGLALTFTHDPEVMVELARLAAAEHSCCAFLSFRLSVDGAGVRFEVHAPAHAQDIVAAVFGTPAPLT